MHIGSREREAGEDRRYALVRQRRHDGQRPPAAREQGSPAEHTLERVLSEAHRGRVGRYETRRRGGPTLDLELGFLRSGVVQELLEDSIDLLDVLSRRQA